MIPYTDTTFDELYADFTQLDQPIPSPKRMPAFEIVNVENCLDFFLNYKNFESVTLPNFMEARVTSYLKLKDVASTIKYFNRAFPT